MEKKYNAVIDIGLTDAESFKLFSKQKYKLLELMESFPNDQVHILEGLVNLIDHIQDQCVDVCNIPSEVVFPKED